ncbi:MAG: hypothetical protein V1655_03715 [bacterium]
MKKDLIKLTKLPYFRTSHIEAFSPYLKKTSIYQKLTRLIKKGGIIKLKNGFYTTKEYKEKHISEMEYFYYLANILRYPSYVSGAYVLQSRGILTEITYPITSITTKSTHRYSNELGEFIYYSISEKLYTGYERLMYKNEPVYVATISKALFDYVYIKYFKIKITASQILEKERLNLENFTENDIAEFKKYCELSGNKILIDLSYKLFKKI